MGQIFIHSQETKEVGIGEPLDRLSTSKDRLSSSSKAKNRLLKYGYNEIPEKKYTQFSNYRLFLGSDPVDDSLVISPKPIKNTFRIMQRLWLHKWQEQTKELKKMAKDPVAAWKWMRRRRRLSPSIWGRPIISVLRRVKGRLMKTPPSTLGPEGLKWPDMAVAKCSLGLLLAARGERQPCSFLN
jgi:hypothetical protein